MKTLLTFLAICIGLSLHSQTILTADGLAGLTTTPSAVASTAWLTSFTPGTIQNAGPYTIGFKFTNGAANVTVTSLGRYVVSGSSETHKLTIYDSSYTVVATANLSTSGLSSGLNYVTLSTPVILTAGQVYYLGSYESGTDGWSDATTYSGTSIITVSGAVYNSGDTCPIISTYIGYIYDGVCFKYSNP